MTTPPPPQDPQYPEQPQDRQQNWQQPDEFPQAPPVNPRETQAPPRPKSVDTAFLLWMVAAAIGVVSAILGLVTQDAVMEETADQLGVAVEQTDAGLGGGVGMIISLVLIAVWILVAFAMRNGANWARIVLTVLGGLNVLFGLVGLTTLGILFAIGALGILQALFNIASLVVIIAAIVFMFRSDANHYFKHS